MYSPKKDIYRYTPNRCERVADMIHQDLANQLLHRVHDPRLRSVLINHVKLSPDLAHAKVYVSTLGDELSALLPILNRASGYLRRSLAKRTKLRITPNLTFYSDDLTKRATDLTNLINQANAGDVELENSNPDDQNF